MPVERARIGVVPGIDHASGRYGPDSRSCYVLSRKIRRGRLRAGESNRGSGTGGTTRGEAEKWKSKTKHIDSIINDKSSNTNLECGCRGHWRFWLKLSIVSTRMKSSRESLT